MDLLIIANGVPLDSSLIGMFEFDQARALSKAGINVTFLAVDLRSIRRKRKFGVTSGKMDGIEYYNISFPVGAVPKILLVGIGKRLIVKLYDRAYSNRKKPDLIHAHFTEVGAIASQLSQSRSVPLVVTEHSSAVADETLKPGFRTVVEMAYGNADALIAVSSPLAKIIKERYGYESFIVPNVIGEGDFFKIVRKRHNPFTFVFTGAIIQHKGIFILLEAFKSVTEELHDVGLKIIGDGEKSGEVKKWIHDNRLSSKIKTYGRLNRSEIADVYSECDCFVLPSFFETFGVVYIEALAAGLPVIGTRCGGPEDIIDESTGILVNCDDVGALREAMINMYKNSSKYDSSKLREDVCKKYSEEAIAKKLIDIYQDVLGK